MKNKPTLAIVGLLIIGTVGYVLFSSKPATIRPGTEVVDNGRAHVAQDAKKYGDSTPPSSGDHAEPIDWGVYNQEVPDINIIHNLEHGGVYISYRPNLPQDQIQKIINLFSEPFSRDGFSPNKAIVAPRAANGSPIIMTSWNRVQKFEQFEEQAMYDYYIKNVGKSPEPTAN